MSAGSMAEALELPTPLCWLLPVIKLIPKTDTVAKIVINIVSLSLLLWSGCFGLVGFWSFGLGILVFCLIKLSFT
jgi:hypothetical protein